MAGTIELGLEYSVYLDDVSMESGLDGRNNMAAGVRDFAGAFLSQWSPA